MIFAAFVCGSVFGFIVGALATLIVIELRKESMVQVKTIRTMKHHERASLIRHGWMTPDGKWTNKGMPTKADSSP